MTSINAIRFSGDTGAMVCDEQRHWNPERLKIYAADKIRSIVPERIREKYGLAAAYGNTGTSAIGDELRFTMHRRVEAEFNRRCREDGKEPESFLSIDEVAQLGWQTICAMKHKHVDEHLKQKYNLSTAEIIRGYRESDGKKIKIGNRDVIKDCMESIARNPAILGSDAVFGNGGILTGFDRESGFRIYVFSMKEGLIEQSESGYAALGSGGDTTNFVIPRLFNRKGVAGRISGIDPAEGIASVLDAVNMATEHNLGVGGYFNIVLFDKAAKSPNGLYHEISDHRSKVVCESVQAQRAGFITHAACMDIVRQVIFEGKDAQWGEAGLWKATHDGAGLHRLLRGYPVIAE